ncbi:MAG: NAD(P)-dependent oxidoreductase [Propionibacteriaceae bacterium]|jgi:nucleoside-diphosphate-sugar epimerase|nr:NAD(P)-dependent oxidoreductase [Propionibacteriaceae bacterium]
MRILVTGASGFIGRRLVPRLTRDGHQVVAITEPGQEDPGFSGGVTIVSVGFDRLLDHIDEFRDMDLIVHLAWAGVSSAAKDDVEVQTSNITYAAQIVGLAREAGIPRILCTGSTSEFAHNEGPITGVEASTPSDVYAATKVAVRMILSVLCAQSGVALAWAAITSVYGPGRTDNNLITYCIRSMLASQPVRVTKLEQVWDYLYVDDLIEALALLAENYSEGVYPVGSGTARPMAEYVRVIEQTVGSASSVDIGAVPYKGARVDNSIVDISRLSSQTGFTPRVSFEVGISRTVEFFRELAAPESNVTV